MESNEISRLLFILVRSNSHKWKKIWRKVTFDRKIPPIAKLPLRRNFFLDFLFNCDQSSESTSVDSSRLKRKFSFYRNISPDFVFNRKNSTVADSLARSQLKRKSRGNLARPKNFARSKNSAMWKRVIYITLFQ